VSFRFRLIAALLAAASLAAQTSEELLRQGLDDLEAGRGAEAIAKLEPVLAERPDDGRLLLALADAYRQAGRGVDAAAMIERVQPLAARQPVLFRGISAYFEWSGDAARAAEFEAQYARAFPEDLSGLGTAAGLYLDAGDFQRAAEFAESALERKKLASLYEILGKARAGLGQSEPAE